MRRNSERQNLEIKRLIVKVQRFKRDLNTVLRTLQKLDRLEPIKTDPRASFEAHEKQLIEGALEQAGHNESAAARILQIGRDRLRYKIMKYGLTGRKITMKSRKS